MTGFRRKLYSRAYVPIEKETHLKRRKDELRFPWDNTVTDNVFRGVKSKAAKKRETERARKEKAPLKRANITAGTEVYAAVDLPERDPMGVYRPPPRRERKNYYAEWKGNKKYENMTLHELLSKVRAKVEAMPRQRSSQKDVDEFLADVMRPLPKNDELKGLRVFTVDDYPEYVVTKEGLDDRLQKKVKQGRDDLAEFERLLNERFSAVSSRALTLPTKVLPALKYHKLPKAASDDEADYVPARRHGILPDDATHEVQWLKQGMQPTPHLILLHVMSAVFYTIL